MTLRPPLGVHKALQHRPKQACFIAISICVEPSQIHGPKFSILVIYSFHMLKCPGTEIFKATTGGKKFILGPPVVALTLLHFFMNFHVYRNFVNKMYMIMQHDIR